MAADNTGQGKTGNWAGLDALAVIGAHLPLAKIAAIATADATDLASAEALANANKAKINAILASLTAAGLMSST